MTRLVLEQRQRVCVELASRGVDAGMLICADDENLDVAAEFGSDTVEAPNRPLGAKCNELLYHAAESGVDWIVWVGSDDWIHPAIFDPLFDLGDQPPLILSGHRFAIVDMRDGRLHRLETPSEYGGIPWILDARLIRDAVRRRNGDRIAPIEPTASRGLDGHLIRGLRLGRVDFRWHFHEPNDFRCVDFKTRVNITPYEGLARNLSISETEDAWTTLREWFPADLVEAARLLGENT